MPSYALTQLADSKLAQDLRSGISDDRTGLAMRLAQIAEFDHRRLFLPAYPSMYQYCLGELKYSEDAACRRLAAGRLARRYPAVFVAIAEGRHSLSTVLMLEPYLLPETAGELIDASSGTSKSALANFLAARFPRPDLPTLVLAVPATPLLAAPEGSASPRTDQPLSGLPAPARVNAIDGPILAQPVPPSSPSRPRVVPLSPERYAIQVTVSKATHDKLRHAQALLSHVVPSGDVAEVLDRALDVLIAHVEKRRFGATDRPSARHQKSSKNPRNIAAHVRRAVRRRDGDQCTYVDDKGRRCCERKFLQFDHIVPVARGGESSVSNLRLRCGAHNRHEADRVYGAGFMERKRAGARQSRAHGLSAERSPPAP